VVWEDGEALILTSYPILELDRLLEATSEQRKQSRWKGKGQMVSLKLGDTPSDFNRYLQA
jgi:hypothetical protein